MAEVFSPERPLFVNFSALHKERQIAFDVHCCVCFRFRMVRGGCVNSMKF